MRDAELSSSRRSECWECAEGQHSGQMAKARQNANRLTGHSREAALPATRPASFAYAAPVDLCNISKNTRAYNMIKQELITYQSSNHL